jgi:hypothetical protein
MTKRTTPQLGDTRRVAVLTKDVPAATTRWAAKGWKVTRKRAVNNPTIDAVNLTLTFVGRPIT